MPVIRELKHRRRMTGGRRPEVNSWCFEWIAHVSPSQAIVMHTSTTEFWVSWRSPESASNLTCLISRKLGVYPGFILYELFDSLLVDKACFYRILLFITYSVNAPLTSVFFPGNPTWLHCKTLRRKGKYQGFLDAICRYFANNLHQLLVK